MNATAGTAIARGDAAVLSVNAGSSSLKFALYPVLDDGVAAAVLTGLAEGLEPGGRPQLRIDRAGQPRRGLPLQPRSDESAFDAALREVVDISGEHGARLAAVAHRVVHGGERHVAPVLVDAAVLAELRTLEPLAPLHQPHNLDGVQAFLQACPSLPQVACFDTAFHATAPAVEQRFALPDALHRQGVRRYGFHGLSYQYVAAELTRRSAHANARLLLAHLGNGASLCAVREGRSVATTMGFSALDGLMMGTRCGAIDAGVLLHLLRQGMDAAALERLLYKQSGLLGVSGLSADMRTLRASAEPGAGRAIELFTHRVLRECGALAACLGGIDVLGFAGGIGEHDAQLRHDLCSGLAFLGVRIDEAANRAADGSTAQAVHAADSSVEVWVVPTDEGRVAASEALRLLAQERPRNTSTTLAVTKAAASHSPAWRVSPPSVTPSAMPITGLT